MHAWVTHVCRALCQHKWLKTQLTSQLVPMHSTCRDTLGWLSCWGHTLLLQSFSTAPECFVSAVDPVAASFVIVRCTLRYSALLCGHDCWRHLQPWRAATFLISCAWHSLKADVCATCALDSEQGCALSCWLLLQQIRLHCGHALVVKIACCNVQRTCCMQVDSCRS